MTLTLGFNHPHPKFFNAFRMSKCFQNVSPLSHFLVMRTWFNHVSELHSLWLIIICSRLQSAACLYGPDRAEAREDAPRASVRARPAGRLQRVRRLRPGTELW